ncbi:acyltransferase [Enterobacterales bacterium CwR94]|nr:acyltransferase [Enterobacterales bacterium CwR94]
MEKKTRFMGLEWLRFLLGIYVMIYHTLHVYPQVNRIPWLRELTSMGFFATSTFFVLSGFLLTHVYFNNNTLREPAKTFWLKRFCNLYPLHIVALVSTVAVVLLAQWLSIPPDGPAASPRFVVFDTNEANVSRELLQHYMTNKELLLNAFLQLTMLQAWNPLYLTFNAPLWSLSTLFFFYLTFPLLAPRLLRIQHRKLAISVIFLIYLLPPILVIAFQGWGMPWTGLLQRGPLLRLPEFLAGILAYSLFRQHQQIQFRPQGVLLGCLILFIVASFLTATWLFTRSGGKHWYYLLHNGLLLPAQLTLVYLSALIPAPKTPWLQRWLPRLGATSLTIFALHVPMFWLWRTFEPLITSQTRECWQDWQVCVDNAANTPLTVTGYVLFLVATVWICLQFQERFVVRVRKGLLARLA